MRNKIRRNRTESPARNGKLVRIRNPFGRRGGNLAGVCEGLAAYFKTEPLYFRLAFIASTFFSGLGILAYLALAIVLPDEKGESLLATIQQQIKSEKTTKRLKDNIWEDEHYQLCDKCDTVVKYESKYCHHCGAKL